MDTTLHCFGVLALECAAAEGEPRLALDRDGADRLGAELAVDLQRLLPGIAALDAVVAGASFDPAEMLRPGWPVHAALAELAARLPGARGGRIVVFGAHEGTMPDGLQPDPQLAGGPLRLLPFALLGDASQVAEVGRQMERHLLDTGMASAATALRAQTLFGQPLEHARFMTLHDLCALTAVQYEHAGLGGLWRLLEAALLDPDREEWLQQPGDPIAVQHAGQVRLAEAVDADAATRRRIRQFVAVLDVHGVAAQPLAVDAGDDPRDVLRRALQARARTQ